jgi:hypothetical protein
MNNTLRLFSFSLFCFTATYFFTGCRKETLPVSPVSLNYFPTKTGKWVEYSVDSVYHGENDNLNDDSVYYYHCEIKEVIDSAYVDGTGREIQVIKRYYRRFTQEDWSLINVWTQYLTSNSAYRVENNISLHKLAFPISADITWNGNDANAEDEELYSYEYFHEPGIFNSLEFDSTLSVIQVDEDNYIERIFGNEIYATGVGLIFRQYDNLGKINGIVVNGYEIRTTVTAFGNNQ